MRSVLGLGLVVVLSIAVFLFASLAFAQGGATGAITGTVQFVLICRAGGGPGVPARPSTVHRIY